MMTRFLTTALVLGVSVLGMTKHAAAQSSVQFYGVIGLGLGGSKSSPRNAPSVSQGLKMVDDIDVASRWGLEGSEDLGGGTKVSFRFESGFSPLSGASRNPYFSRESSLALGGSWGTLKAGRMFTVVDDTSYLLDINGNTALSAYNSSGLVSWLNYDSPIDNAAQIQYASPLMGGLEFRVGAVFKDSIRNAQGDSTLWNGVGKARNLFQLGTSYTWDKLLLGATLESKGGAGNRLAYSAGARYDFSVLEASVTYNRMALEALGQGYTAAVAVPVGVWRFGTQWGFNTRADVAALASGKSRAMELFATYEMSKRTLLLANFNRTRYSTWGSEQVYGAGIRHAF